jgi:hypothetical protein
MFVAPALAWAGVALVAIPIIVHLLNRRRHKIVQWAAMEYLLEAMRRNRRRLRLQDLILLTLRSAAILLLALALARPLGCAQGMAGRLLGTQGGLQVLVIDSSGSMNYRHDGGLSAFERARSAAKSILERLRSGQDAFAVILTAGAEEGDGARLALAPTYDLAAGAVALDALQPTDASTDLPGALTLAAELARAQSTPGRARLTLITDSTRHAWQGKNAENLAALAADLTSVFRVTHVSVGEAAQANSAVVSMQSGQRAVSTAVPADFAATARHYGPAEARAGLQWALAERMLAQRENLLLGGESSPQTLSQTVLTTPGPAALAARLTPEDALPQDDARYLAVDIVSHLRALVVEGERAGGSMGGSASFLSVALAPSATSSAVQVKAIDDLELASQPLGDYNAVILASVPAISPADAQRLLTFVREGGSLILFMGESVSPENWNTTLAPSGLLPGRLLRRVQTTEGAEPHRFAFSPTGQLHPLLWVFRGEEKSGLSSARIFSYFELEPSPHAERVLDFASGHPAIALARIGDGRVVFFATSADSRWTTLPAKPAYVALLHEVLLGTVTTGDAWLNRRVGEPLVIPSRIPLAGAPRLLDPRGAEVLLTADATGAHRSAPLTRAGLHRLETGRAVYPIAVNFPAEESDLRWLPHVAIRQALGGIDVREQNIEAATLADDDSPRDFGWSFLAACAALLCAEAFLAMWFRRSA